MRWVTLISLLVPTAALAAEPIQSYDAYKSWFVACDNTLSCVAKGFADGAKRAELRIERAAGPDGALSMTIAAEKKFSLSDVKIDGKSAGLSAQDWKAVDGEAGPALSSDRLAAIQALVARLRNGTKLTVTEGADVPLDGFAATMVRFDERQGRLDSVTALLKPGAAPASRVPTAPALPTIRNRPVTATLASGEAQRLIEQVRTGQRAALEKEDCDANVTVMKPEAYALDDKQALVFIPCLMGAYQGSSMAFLAQRGSGAAQELIAPLAYAGNKADDKNVRMFTESDFDPETGTLSMAARGRGMADCGISASWIWNGQAFQMSALSLQIACGGLGPGDWPTLFRSVQ